MQITVFAHPNSKKPRVEKDLRGSLHIYVSAPPLESRANLAVAAALAEHLRVAKSQLRLVRGARSKQKTFELS